MLEFMKIFDQYSLKARLFPALIAGIPILVFSFATVSWDHLGLPHAVVSLICLLLFFAFADLARRSGIRIEERLGTRATPELFYFKDTTISESSKTRYRAFIARQIGKPPPTAEDEVSNLDAANDFYISAGAWLREHTRNTSTFKILFNENITYGFRRNLRGLRLISLVLNFIIFTSCILIKFFRWEYFYKIEDMDARIFIVFISVGIHSLYMIFAVNDRSVRDASKIYGKQLILCTETLMASKSTTTRSRRQPEAK